MDISCNGHHLKFYDGKDTEATELPRLCWHSDWGTVDGAPVGHFVRISTGRTMLVMFESGINSWGRRRGFTGHFSAAKLT
jgi:hypothetical protein